MTRIVPVESTQDTLARRGSNSTRKFGQPSQQVTLARGPTPATLHTMVTTLIQAWLQPTYLGCFLLPC